jgi:hypothetical protein
MDPTALTGTIMVIVWVVLLCIGMCLLYGVVRAGVAAGLRDHHKRLEKKRKAEMQASKSAHSAYQAIVPTSPPNP